jgi:hypothetical protein
MNKHFRVDLDLSPNNFELEAVEDPLKEGEEWMLENADKYPILAQIIEEMRK